ncbi:MAG TPA: transcription-repair coupling factor [Acetobacteraceae bacterium]|nr:transcription-repair coupling factor [Acetobacteraceae bacterium]
MSNLTVYGAPEGYDALLLARRRAEHKGTLLHVARDDARMARMKEALGCFAPEIEVLSFPAWDCLPYDRVSPKPELVSERIATLANLLGPAPSLPSARPRILLTTVNALVQRVPPRAAFTGRSLALKAGGTVDSAALLHFLEANGYGRAGTVMEPGEFAIRGGIIDIFPAGAEEPVRLDLFGEQIETLRRFDPATQRSGAALSSLTLHPVSEVPLDAVAIARFRAAWRERFGLAASADAIYLAISEGRRHPGMEHWLPLFYPALETLLDYLPNAAVSFDHQADEVLAARLEMIADHYEARQSPPRDGETPYRPLPPELLYLDRPSFAAMIEGLPVFTFSPYARPDGAPGLDAGARPGPLFTRAGGRSDSNAFTELSAAAARWAAEGKKFVLAAWTEGSCERLRHLLSEHGFPRAERLKRWADMASHPADRPGLLVLGLERGFAAENVVVVAEQDLLGERISRPPRRRKSADELIAEASELASGDLVVHQEYGIGRYDGLATLAVDQAPHDCLRLIYDGDEKLFLPVENIELLSRYGQADGAALDKLGGAGWQTRKARMQNRIRDIARELIALAAERQVREAPLLAPPEGSWEEFCARFPFVETEDQSRAIADVLGDLASGRPMDRLICGDVGFGKTEVALRAAYVAAMAGMQVAVVVPTTLLSRQHYRTFSSRFAGLGLTIAQLSRMVSAKEAAEVRAGLASGAVNIVVGTHALLAKGIHFAALGLLVIDEEQHFGVAHKERLKSLRADVHVLTLTATPIPRTLQLALSGVREMSLIATPPVDRLAVRTFIMPFDALVIHEAIQRERFRGGQVFCVVPRIEDLPRMAERLREIVPEARLAEAHGRLAPTALERVMTEFSDGHYDILLSTNIIESGLDMPAVNTLIVHRADQFGLGQLYQLRGRVGRGKQRGYAYFTWPPNQILSATAQKRLDVMQTLDSLGAGFTLASHDLDIRGAGNLLGAEQSGHIREVGIELYQQMLEDAVAEVRGREGKERRADRDWTPGISLGLPVLIPETYVPDLPVRLGLYRRIGTLASDAESEAMAAELVDRFGPLPAEVENLLAVVALKRACREAGVERLEAGPKGLVLSFRANQFRNPGGLAAWLATQRSGVRLRPDHKIALARELEPAQRLAAARALLAELARIATRAEAA